jgi:hypothetical protein
MLIEKYPLVVFYSEMNSDIIYAEFPKNLIIDLTIAKEIVANRFDLAKDKCHYIIIDISNVKKISGEAKEYLQRPDAGLKNILGAAFVATNPVSTMIANIFIKTPKDFQAKFFSSKDAAFQWIQGVRAKNN